MHKLLLQPTSMAHWYALVNEAEFECELELGEELESYLVFLLMRFTERPELSQTILALEFLESLQKGDFDRCAKLQDVGDKCLIYSGFFPEQIQRRRLKESYYIDLGQNAYYMLASMSKLNLANLYQELCEGFLRLREVLLAMRGDKQTFITLKQNSRQTSSLIHKRPITKH